MCCAHPRLYGARLRSESQRKRARSRSYHRYNYRLDRNGKKWRLESPAKSSQQIPKKNCVSMLVRLAPGTDYPPHCHAGVEELHLLHGELMIGDKKLYPGDYNRAEPDSVDHRVRTETGCTCVLVTSTKDVIL